MLTFFFVYSIFHVATADEAATQTPASKPLYGALAGMSPATDPRLDKTYAAKMLGFGLGGLSPPMPMPMEGNYQETVEKFKVIGGGFQQLFDGLANGVPLYDVNKREIKIDGVDGNKIPLTIYQGTSKTCYYHEHGGGMAFMSSREAPFTLQLNHMSGKHGLTIVSVDYRTYLHHVRDDIEVTQFPAGLNDCYSGLEWLYEHKEELGCETVVNFGESGGGNLCLTTAFKTLKEGRPELLDGSFCFCPEASADMFDERHPSMFENAGYWLNMANEPTQRFVDMYTADLKDKKNPLAWAIEAKPADMKGMKPVMIIVNELDPLRDTGLEVYRNLLAGGVQAEARVVAGTLHAADTVGYGSTYIFDTSVNAMKSFAAGLRGTILVEAPAPTPLPESVAVKPEGETEA